ncbi:response regulator receiver domain [Serratia sp. DD3]|uniref:response regulator receiver domain n=1 Tax=Serratia sp. DD3 TaxID=1410619 RepID=UPI0003C5067D|nr:response regulator receiver domain [Serratia sp. DD3]KEY58970.1 hypothetical protein SRDD_21670 [Serratia sp. DD3]
MRTGEFFESSRKIVQDFLNSVIAIDDNLFFEKKHQASSIMDVDDGFDIIVEEDSGLGQSVNTQSVSRREQGAPINHPLDYQDLSLAFADYGINCCAFRPDIESLESIESAADKIKKIAKRTDITILDWSMDDKYGVQAGTLAKLSINKILQDDKLQNGRLRLIVIYTGEPNPLDIAENIRQDISSLDIKAIRNGGSIVFQCPDLEFCQITIIEKKVEAKDLRDEVIALFTELTIGLLSNATLSAIGEVRDKTHHILHSFNKRLDPAYLSHVIGLLSSPQVREKSHEIAFDYATDLISEELKSNLQISHSIKRNLGLERLKEWVDCINPDKLVDFFEIKVGDCSEVGISSERLKKLLSYTTDEELVATLTSVPVIMKSDQKTLENFSKRKIQLKLKSATYLSHEALSAIECKRRDLLSLKTNSPLPTIKQGTIVIEGRRYYICMQPLCDSVRIEKETAFIFLEIKSVNGNQSFTHVLRDAEGNFIKFSIKPGSKGVRIFKLKPDTKTNTVKAINDDCDFKIKYEKDDGQVGSLVWLGELKSNVAQAIANKLAEQISRVGLDTNEWLRRH